MTFNQAAPQQQPNPYFTNAFYQSVGSAAQTPGPLFTPSLTSLPPTPGSLAGRKRSRGDIFAPEDDDEAHEDGAVATPMHEVSQTMQGPTGLANPNGIDSSDSWNDAIGTRKPFHIKRPSVSSRKSQRKAAIDDESDQLGQLIMPHSLREATTEPLIDEATRVLGISWTRMDSTPNLLVSQAAYTKWIQNHYPALRNVTVWFEYQAIPGYLVEATNVYSGQKGYYIFSDNLTEGRLVTTEPDQLMPRLKMLPALHLAAPGGHIRAETDSLRTKTSERAMEHDQASTGADAVSDDVLATTHEPNGMCSAHEMEMD